MRAKLIFEKISGTDKLLARQIKRKRTKITNIGSEMKGITIDSTDIKSQ